MDLIDELLERGLIEHMAPGLKETREQLNKEVTSGYIGFDPTADSLHIGSLVPILLLVHFQRAGHKPIALVGGATGMVGDPSGKSQERNLLSENVLETNLLGIRKQLKKFLDFDASKTNAAEIVNNYDWFKKISFLHFIRDVGKHITVNYMMAKESVRKRLAGENGMSFTEFTYQLIQGYDFYWLNKHKNVKLQMGGSDQLGNIITGIELIRRKAGGEAFAFTCPLITKADGGKFGKTEKGNIWLDAEKTSPYLFYQFWLNASDDDAMKWIRIFTFLSSKEINDLIESHFTNVGARELQKRLAKEVTVFVHGEEEYQKAADTTGKLFSNQKAPASSLSLADLESMEGVIKIDYPVDKLTSGTDIISFLAEIGIFSSKSEARKMLLNGGVSVNRDKVDDAGMQLEQSLLLHHQYLLIQKGKKNYYLVKAV